MASSNMIVLNSKFNPFSYQELLAPVQAADTEHKIIQEEEGKLQTLADAWKNKLNPELDKKAYTQYTNYINNLKSQSEALAKNGLTPTSRKSLVDARAAYSSDIIPIETAYNTRLQRADEQRKLSLSDPTYMHERDLGTVSIDEFMDNPTLSSRGISGSYFTKAVADAAEQMSKETRTPEGKAKWKSILNRQYWEKIDQYGFTSKEVLDAINGNPKAAAELTKLVKNSVNSSGIMDWNNPEAIKRAYGYANQGLYHAIGTAQEKEMANRNFLDPLQRAQLNAMTPPTDPGSVPSTESYFETNISEGKKINGITSKLLNSEGKPLATYFGKKGEINPLGAYEKYKNFKENSLSNYNKYIDRLAQKYATNGKVEVKMINGQKVLSGPGVTGQLLKEYQVYQRGFRDQTKANNNMTRISDEEYNYLKQIGIKPNDDYKTVVSKINTHKEMAQRGHNFYNLQIQPESMLALSNDISQKLNTGRAVLKPIDKESMTVRDKKVKDSDFTDGYDEKKGKSNITKVQYSPKFGGLVVTNQNGDMFKVTEVMDNETTNIIKNNQGFIDKYYTIAMDPNQPENIRRQAMDIVNSASNDLTFPVSTKISGFYNVPNATSTSKNPSQIIFQQN